MKLLEIRKNWKKIAQTGAVGAMVIGGNAIAVESLRGVYQEAALANARIRVLEQHLMDTDFGLCLSLRQNMPSSIEEDQAFCNDWTRERGVKYGILPERGLQQTDQAD